MNLAGSSEFKSSLNAYRLLMHRFCFLFQVIR